MLTVKQIERAAAKKAAYKLADATGLYLHVSVTGRKTWRYNFLEAGRAQTKTYGAWPDDLTLAQARLAHAQFRQELRAHDGVRPSNIDQEAIAERQRKASVVPAPNGAAMPTFSELAAEWARKHTAGLRNSKHRWQVISTLERHAFPVIGDMPVSKITRLDLVRVVKTMEHIPETAQRVGQRMRAVLDYAVDVGLLASHPAAGLARVMPKKTVTHFARVKLQELPKLLTDIATLESTVTRLGLLLLLHTFVRYGDTAHARWEHVDFKAKEWLIPTTKMGHRHVVPLSTQVLALLRQLHEFSGGVGPVLPGTERAGLSKTRAVSENTLLSALYTLGYKGRMTVHGFRGLASTTLNESLKWDERAIEAQLAHREKNAVKRAYNHAEYIDTRRAMMQWWSDLIDAYAIL